MEWLSFFQPGVLFDQFLLAVAGKTDGQLGLVARAFSTQNQAPSVLRMTHIGPGQGVRCRAALRGLFRLSRRSEVLRLAHAGRSGLEKIRD